MELNDILRSIEGYVRPFVLRQHGLSGNWWNYGKEVQRIVWPSSFLPKAHVKLMRKRYEEVECLREQLAEARRRANEELE